MIETVIACTIFLLFFSWIVIRQRDREIAALKAQLRDLRAKTLKKQEDHRHSWFSSYR